MKKRGGIYIGVEPKKLVGIKRWVYVVEWLFSKSLTTYLPNCCLTARAVPLCHTELMSESFISFLSSGLHKVLTFKVSEARLRSFNCFLMTMFS